MTEPGGVLSQTVNSMFGEQGVTGRYAQGWRDAATALEQAQTPAQYIRGAATVIGNVMGAISMPQDLLNVGFATLTNSIAAFVPPFPAAFLGSLYVGLPHAHSHPPSLIPPAPPVPLPSIGSVMLGTCLRVLINGMPAARCGDIGLAPTCVGFVPFFQIKTGSSKVFLGGNRAARMLDICSACSKADNRESSAGKFMAAVGKAAGAVSTAIEVGGKVAAGAAIIADAAEAAAEDDAAMSAAKGMAAAMGAAQMAADIAAAAITSAMGTDPGIPPGTMGAITLGSPTVLIGGFPMVNIPNPVDLLLGKLKRYKPRKPKGKNPEGDCPDGSCP